MERKHKFFRCGHPYDSTNITWRGGDIKCRICVKESDRKSNMKYKQKMREFKAPCLLSEMWK